LCQKSEYDSKHTNVAFRLSPYGEARRRNGTIYGNHFLWFDTKVCRLASPRRKAKDERRNAKGERRKATKREHRRKAIKSNHPVVAFRLTPYGEARRHSCEEMVTFELFESGKGETKNPYQRYILAFVKKKEKHL
jgi:hypothetical protein